MPAMLRVLTIATVSLVVLAISVVASADTVYICGQKDGVPHFVISNQSPGKGCKVYSGGKAERRESVPKGAKCRQTRFRDTVFYHCQKDGVSWYFNKPVSRPKATANSTPKSAPVAAKAAVSKPQPEPEIVATRQVREPATEMEVFPDELHGIGSRSIDSNYLKTIIVKASQEAEIPVALLRAVIEVESGANPDVVSPAGAQGLMQLMPVTASYLDVKDPFDPEENVAAGARLLRILSDRFNGDIEKTVAAYFAGAGAVRRSGGVPTKAAENYVSRVMKKYNQYSPAEEM